MAIKALIFDVDGTLAETEELHREAFNEAFAAADRDWHWDRDLYRDLLKVTGGKERIRHFLQMSGLELDGESDQLIADLHLEKNRRYAEKVTAGIELRPGVAALIDEAKHAGVKLAIATTTSRSNLDALLAAGFGDGARDWFEAIVTGEDVQHKKPDPEAYLIALRRLGCQAGDCVAFEDSRNGLEAAMGAGITVVITPGIYTANETFDGAALLIDNLGTVKLAGLRSLATN